MRPLPMAATRVRPSFGGYMVVSRAVDGCRCETTGTMHERNSWSSGEGGTTSPSTVAPGQPALSAVQALQPPCAAKLAEDLAQPEQPRP